MNPYMLFQNWPTAQGKAIWSSSRETRLCVGEGEGRPTAVLSIQTWWNLCTGLYFLKLFECYVGTELVSEWFRIRTFYQSYQSNGSVKYQIIFPISTMTWDSVYQFSSERVHAISCYAEYWIQGNFRHV